MRAPLLLPLLAVAATAEPALANLHVYNATQDTLKLEVTLPNGMTDPEDVDPAVDSLDYGGWSFAVGVKSVKLSVSNDDGVVVWSGTVGANDVGILVPSGKGTAYVPAGAYSTSGSWKAAAFVNATGEALTLDLVGQSGIAAHRGITPGATFDLKKAVKLDPRESSFAVVLHPSASAAPLKIESKVAAERFYVLWKRSRDGEYRVSGLGYLPPPPAKARK